VSQRFDTLAARASLPPNHAAQAAARPGDYGPRRCILIKAISEMLGHSTSAFTADVYTEVAEELADAAASAIAAYVAPPWQDRSPVMPILCPRWAI
jgi:hypothetical protein